MINRREVFKTLAGGAMLCGPAAAAKVKKVLVMFKCHLDVGFTDTQAGVMRKYFEVYYPAAMKRAAAMRESGADRYTWTTGSWLMKLPVAGSYSHELVVEPSPVIAFRQSPKM